MKDFAAVVTCQALEGRVYGPEPCECNARCATSKVGQVYIYWLRNVMTPTQPPFSPSQVLAEELPALLATVKFKGNMRWRGDAVFSRPIRWLLALHGAAVVPLQYAGLAGGNTTRVLRNADQPEMQVSTQSGFDPRGRSLIQGVA